ncbi:hypothetical protein BDW67DRAFT_192771 [Aspergillus spinulosporus]
MVQAKLPAELILFVVDCLLPSDSPVVFNVDHVITRTLLSLTLVCKLVSRAAKKLLLKYCLYINSAQRLNLLLKKGTLSVNNSQSLSMRLFLSPFPANNLNIPPLVHQINDLSAIISANLTSLIIDMPLRHLYPEDDVHQLRPILRTAFSRMAQLREFVSVRDELYLSTYTVDLQAQEQGREQKHEPAVWSLWPNLQRLALYNVAVDSSQFIEGLRRCLNLTHLVLVRPDGLTEDVSPERIDPESLPSLQQLTIVNTGSGFSHTFQVDEEAWQRSFVGRLEASRHLGVHGPEDKDSRSDSVASYLSLRTPFGRDNDDIAICQEWLLEQASSGALWRMADDHRGLDLSREPKFAFIDLAAMTPESFLDLAYGEPDAVRWESYSPNLWTCDVCSAVFQRVDHFKRHSATHRTAKPYSCDFCGCVYKRGSKRSCSGGQPCSECHSRGRTCSYDRLGNANTTTAVGHSKMWRFPRVEGPAGSHDMGQLPNHAALDRRPASEGLGTTWTLGPQNFYASADVCYRAYSRLH